MPASCYPRAKGTRAMVDLQRLREQRAKVSANEAALQGARQQLSGLRSQLAALKRQGDVEAVRRLQGALDELERRTKQQQQTLDRERATSEVLREATLSGSSEWPTLSKTVPILLLPVRLETHFVRDGQRISELLVRVYPDDVHVHDHEAELSLEE